MCIEVVLHHWCNSLVMFTAGGVYGDDMQKALARWSLIRGWRHLASVTKDSLASGLCGAPRDVTRMRHPTNVVAIVSILRRWSRPVCRRCFCFFLAPSWDVIPDLVIRLKTNLTALMNASEPWIIRRDVMMEGE